MLNKKSIVGYFSKISVPQIFHRNNLFIQQNQNNSNGISNLVRGKQVKFLEQKKEVLSQQKSEIVPFLAPYEIDYVTAKSKREALEQDFQQRENRWKEDYTKAETTLRQIKAEYQSQSIAMTLEVAATKHQVDAVVYHHPSEHETAVLLQLVEPLEERTKRFLQLQYEYQLVNKRYEDMLSKKRELESLKENVRELKEQEETSLKKYRSVRRKWNDITTQDRRVRMLLNEVETNAIGFAGGIFDLFTWRFWRSIGETLYLANRR